MGEDEDHDDIIKVNGSSSILLGRIRATEE
jgi:hypothetical protein